MNWVYFAWQLLAHGQIPFQDWENWTLYQCRLACLTEKQAKGGGLSAAEAKAATRLKKERRKRTLQDLEMTDDGLESS